MAAEDVPDHVIRALRVRHVAVTTTGAGRFPGTRIESQPNRGILVLEVRDIEAVPPSLLTVSLGSRLTKMVGNIALIGPLPATSSLTAIDFQRSIDCAYFPGLHLPCFRTRAIRMTATEVIRRRGGTHVVQEQ